MKVPTANKMKKYISRPDSTPSSRNIKYCRKNIIN